MEGRGFSTSQSPWLWLNQAAASHRVDRDRPGLAQGPDPGHVVVLVRAAVRGYMPTPGLTVVHGRAATQGRDHVHPRLNLLTAASRQLDVPVDDHEWQNRVSGGRVTSYQRRGDRLVPHNA